MGRGRQKSQIGRAGPGRRRWQPSGRGDLRKMLPPAHPCTEFGSLAKSGLAQRSEAPFEAPGNLPLQTPRCVKSNASQVIASPDWRSFAPDHANCVLRSKVHSDADLRTSAVVNPWCSSDTRTGCLPDQTGSARAPAIWRRRRESMQNRLSCRRWQVAADDARPCHRSCDGFCHRFSHRSEMTSKPPVRRQHSLPISGFNSD